MSTATVCIPANRPWIKTYQAHGLPFEVDVSAGFESLGDFFAVHAAKAKDSIAYTCLDVSITYAQLDQYTRQFAAYLQSLGLQKGDKVAVMMPNLLQYPIAMFGILRAGMILVNINPMYTPHELEHQLNDSEAQAIVVMDYCLPTFEQVENIERIRHVIRASIDRMPALATLSVDYSQSLPKDDKGYVMLLDILMTVDAASFVPPVVTADDIAALQYTGGTTGVSKGAMLTHGNLIANTLQTAPYYEVAFKSQDLSNRYFMVALPLYHIFSLTACVLLGLKMGAALLLIPNPRNLDALVADYAKYRPIHFPAVNTMFNALTHHAGFCALDHSHLERSLGGGMPVLSDTAKAWQRLTGVEITEAYGLSETSPMLTMNPFSLGYNSRIGLPGTSTDIKLLDDQDREVAIGEAGEICAKGPQVMLGYWKRPDETAKVMTDDGYFRTGDIGVMDEDGFIKLVDRKKDMILVSGFNVYPTEVEEVMSQHPKIRECGVIGVPDEHSGEVPKIYIVKSDLSLSIDDVRAWAVENLTGYKRPKHIVFIDELPKSNVGKILRKELRKLD